MERKNILQNYHYDNRKKYTKNVFNLQYYLHDVEFHGKSEDIFDLNRPSEQRKPGSVCGCKRNKYLRLKRI